MTAGPGGGEYGWGEQREARTREARTRATGARATTRANERRQRMWRWRRVWRRQRKPWSQAAGAAARAATAAGVAVAQGTHTGEVGTSDHASQRAGPYEPAKPEAQRTGTPEQPHGPQGTPAARPATADCLHEAKAPLGRQPLERSCGCCLRGPVGKRPHVALVGGARWPDEAAEAKRELGSHLTLRAREARPPMVGGAARAGTAVTVNEGGPSRPPGLLQGAGPVDQRSALWAHEHEGAPGLPGGLGPRSSALAAALRRERAPRAMIRPAAQRRCIAPQQLCAVGRAARDRAASIACAA